MLDAFIPISKVLRRSSLDARLNSRLTEFNRGWAENSVTLN